jgi:DNA repair protein RecO (recombination protein O)
VTFFTRGSGKITAIAKGSKRPKSAFDGPIEMFSQGRIVFSGRAREKLATLTEFEQGPGFAALSGNLFTFNCCLFGAELLNSMTEDCDPHPQLFDSFLQLLQGAYEIRDALHGSRDMLGLLILFQLSLLKEVGLQPVLNACANCKTRYEVRDTRYEVYFSSCANGLICRDCEGSFPDKVKMTASSANCLSGLKMLADADERTLKQVEKILIYHFTELLGRRPKMATYVLKR